METPNADVARERDPVCGMSVRLDAALEEGLVAEHDAHTYYFCRTACLDAFRAAPEQYVTSHRHPTDAAAPGTPAIDDGMRLWYESCSCCLSDAYPDVKAALDAQKLALAEPTAAAGICEVAEAETAAT